MANLLRKIFVLLIGLIVIVFGIILLPLPGPGLVVILAGLGIIGAEFPPVRRWTARKWAELREKTPLRSNPRPPSSQ
ncbi:MAG TPA: hypothetical protein ENH10_02355 [Bacteroidetes bacterium]|nr:hypothetical protein [Bacteroidota bacterium]HEX03983.1 hypothetical protein [Bacteroidota bacterium]